MAVVPVYCEFRIKLLVTAPKWKNYLVSVLGEDLEPGVHGSQTAPVLAAPGSRGTTDRSGSLQH